MGGREAAELYRRERDLFLPTRRVFSSGLASVLASTAVAYSDSALASAKTAAAYSATGSASTSMDLGVTGAGHSSLAMDLLTVGVDHQQGSLPLSVACPDLPQGELTLFASGGQYESSASQAPLLLLGGPVRGELPVALLGEMSLSASLPLSMTAHAASASGSCELALANAGVERAVTLLLKGPGLGQGNQESQEDMPLFLQRPFEAEVALTLRGPGLPASSEIPLRVGGSNAQSASADLSVPAVNSRSENSQKLYVRGR